MESELLCAARELLGELLPSWGDDLLGPLSFNGWLGPDESVGVIVGEVIQAAVQAGGTNSGCGSCIAKNCLSGRIKRGHSTSLRRHAMTSILKQDMESMSRPPGYVDIIGWRDVGTVVHLLDFLASGQREEVCFSFFMDALDLGSKLAIITCFPINWAFHQPGQPALERDRSLAIW